MGAATPTVGGNCTLSLKGKKKNKKKNVSISLPTKLFYWAHYIGKYMWQQQAQP
jgi:hypothetical protein